MGGNQYGAYTPGRSIAFIVDQPVMGEIFAADFRGRVVHHLLINKLNPLFEHVYLRNTVSSKEAATT
ncbi:MAG: reverse transcriptase/maturase family protein, partial [Legionella sp.]